MIAIIHIRRQPAVYSMLIPASMRSTYVPRLASNPYAPLPPRIPIHDHTAINPGVLRDLTRRRLESSLENQGACAFVSDARRRFMLDGVDRSKDAFRFRTKGDANGIGQCRRSVQNLFSGGGLDE
jgi:hypothetical protein